MFTRIVLYLLVLVPACAAVPAPAVSSSFSRRALPADAPFTLPDSTYQSAIHCPDGIANKPGGIVLLVHGTASTGNESWGSGPYVQLLPAQGPGFDVCWIDLPNRSMSDAQLSAEYVAFGLRYLAALSPTSNNKINVIGHSQGAGLNIPWALTFWPSTRALVTNFISLAGLFHGTAEGSLLCDAETILSIGCQASLLQQGVSSHYLAAQNSNADANSGAQALIPTTSLYTTFDDVIQPEQGSNPTSALTGATVIPLQSNAICGPTHPADHFTILVDPAAFSLAVDAITNGRPADAASFNKSFCSGFVENTALNFSNLPDLVEAGFHAVLEVVDSTRVKEEPQLQSYVCDRGYSTVCGKAGSGGSASP